MATALVPAVIPSVQNVQQTDPTEARRQRGLAIAALSKIIEKKPGIWTVPSQSGSGNYWVRSEGDKLTCTCPDYEQREQPCKHVYAVEFTIQRKKSPDGTVTETQTVTVTRTTKTTAHRPTYKQNWPAYNAAQTNEKAKFQVLLCDLCQGIQEPPRVPKRGGQPFRLADVTFAAVFKVFSTISGRRFACDLSEAHAKGYMQRLPHYNTVFSYLEKPDLTPILRALIAESAKPLRTVEVDFAVDSSGFSTSRFVRWFDHKYGKPMREYDWVKCSVMTGVKTNVVTAVEIDERYAGDCPKFAPLVKATAQSFRINEVSADTAYSSYDNNELVESLGGTPFISFKANANPKRPGVYDRMFHYFSLRRDEFLSHYHKRSNVETTFSMIKAKFGDHLRSKMDTAMVNEALAKVLCHNICCVIQSMYELGISPVFWGEDEAAEVESEIAETTDADEMIAALAWV